MENKDNMLTSKRTSPEDGVVAVCVNNKTLKSSLIYVTDKEKPSLSIRHDDITPYLPPHIANIDLQRALSKSLLTEKDLDTVEENEMHNFYAPANHTLYPYPTNREDQREYQIISGASGKGKTYYAGRYVEGYNKQYPNRKIYVIASKPQQNDKVFSALTDIVTSVPQDKWWDTFVVGGKPGVKKPPVKKRKIQKKKRTMKKRKKNEDEDSQADEGSDEEKEDEKEEEEEDEEEEEEEKPADSLVFSPIFKNCLVVFDDLEGVPDDLHKLAGKLKDYIVSTCREKKVDVIECNHMLLNYQKSRVALNEASAIVIFPPCKNTLRRYLEVYLEESGENIKKIMKEKTRWIAIHKTNPATIVTSEKIYILK